MQSHLNYPQSHHCTAREGSLWALGRRQCRAAPAFSRLPCRSLSDRRPNIGGHGDTQGVDIATGDGAGPRQQATSVE